MKLNKLIIYKMSSYNKGTDYVLEQEKFSHEHVETAQKEKYILYLKGMIY